MPFARIYLLVIAAFLWISVSTPVCADQKVETVIDNHVLLIEIDDTELLSAITLDRTYLMKLQGETWRGTVKVATSTSVGALFLIEVGSGGTACPAMFQMVVARPQKPPLVSKIFGTCSDFATVSISNEIKVIIPRTPNIAAVTATVTTDTILIQSGTDRPAPGLISTTQAAQKPATTKPQPGAETSQPVPGKTTTSTPPPVQVGPGDKAAPVAAAYAHLEEMQKSPPQRQQAMLDDAIRKAKTDPAFRALVQVFRLQGRRIDGLPDPPEADLATLCDQNYGNACDFGAMVYGMGIRVVTSRVRSAAFAAKACDLGANVQKTCQAAGVGAYEGLIDGGPERSLALLKRAMTVGAEAEKDVQIVQSEINRLNQCKASGEDRQQQAIVPEWRTKVCVAMCFDNAVQGLEDNPAGMGTAVAQFSERREAFSAQQRQANIERTRLQDKLTCFSRSEQYRMFRAVASGPANKGCELARNGQSPNCTALCRTP